ncbi:MAG: MFS transporter [Acidobacteria bacterium]|nr:MFS transporter [Acidobacteriota bacterium]
MPTLVSTLSLATRTPARIRRRILPFVFLLYIVAYLDRANVAFAKMPMTADLHFSEAVFGFGAGIFFIGYLLLEIPGALIVERWSARKWMSRILLTWGLTTVLIGFVRTPVQFYSARFLLGAAEAGFFPGIIVYLNHWFTRRDRARAMAGFILGIPISLVLGAPLSALILQLHWFGLAGWRWVFILQGLPAVVLGVVTLFYLTDHPRDARWLDREERDWITAELEAEKQEKRAMGHVSVWQALLQRNVLLLALALCLANTGGYAFVFWLPTIIRNRSSLSVSWATACAALPFGVGIVGLLLGSRSSDRTGERRLHTALPLMMQAVFFMLAGLPGQSFPLVLLWLCLTAVVGYSWPPPFWVLPTATLGESAAAASIGLINAIGNLGGFIGPTVVGYLLSRNFTYTTAILFLSSCFLVAGVLILNVRVRRVVT